MAAWWRKLRGVFGTGLVWGLPASVVGALGGVVASVLGGAPLLGSIAAGTVVVGGSFFLLGASFAAAFTLAEGRRTMSELSPWRAALWGAFAGGALPILGLLVLQPETATLLSDPQLLAALLAAVGSYGGLSAALAAGTVALAQHTPAELAAPQTSSDSGLLEASTES